MRLHILSGLPFFLLFGSISAHSQFRYEAYLPHIANGTFAEGSFRTTFILFNNTDNNEEAKLRLTGDDGKPLAVTIPGLGAGSEFTIALSPGATRMVQTDGTGKLVAGGATVTTSSRIGLSAIFSIYDTAGNFVTEAGVGDSPTVIDFVIPVDVTGDFNTGLALFNPASFETSIDLTLLDAAGKETGKRTLKLAPGEHLARYIAGPDQLFPSTTDFRGMLSVRSSFYIPALTLRQHGTPLSYTSLPVVDSYLGQTSLILPHVANGSFGGGSFKTSFLFLNTQSVPANVNLLLRESGGAPFKVNLTGQGTGSDFNFRLEPSGSVIFQTDGSGPLAAGAALINSDVPIGASGIFSVFDAQGRFQTEAGVGADTPIWGITLPVDATGKFDTGVAIFNHNDTGQGQLTLRLWTEDGEAKGESKKIPLRAGNHMAKFVSELFPGTTNFRGSLSIDGASVVALTLRQNSSPLAYTSLPVKQGVSMGRIQPVLEQTKTGITATADTKVDAMLATGFKLAGKINGSGYPGVVGVQSSKGEIYGGRIGYSAPTPTYLLVLPAGTYNLKVCYEAQGGYANITYTDPNPVQVSADTTRDITLPPVGLTGISGKVSGLSSLPQVQFKSIVLNSVENTVWVQMRLEDDGTYRGVISPGSFRANLYLPNAQLPEGGTQHMTIFNLGTVNVGSSPMVADFAVPPLAKLSGTMSGAGPTGGSVIATDRSAPAVAMDSCGYFPAYNSTTVDTAGGHQMLLVNVRSYDVEVQLPVIHDVFGYAGILRYPVPAAVVTLNGVRRFDVSIPSLPGFVSASGKVTDGSGRGLANVEVTVESQSLTGLANAELTSYTRTDEDGNYRFTLLSGTNYTLKFYPPIPAP